MQFPHTHTTTRRKHERAKITKQIKLPPVTGILILSVASLILCAFLVFFTSPENMFMVSLFFISLGVLIWSFFRLLHFSVIISFIIAITIIGIVVLRILQMASLLNIVLVIAVGVCFVSFARNLN